MSGMNVSAAAKRKQRLRKQKKLPKLSKPLMFTPLQHMQSCLIHPEPHPLPSHRPSKLTDLSIHEYFHEKNSAKGLDHIKQSADGRCDYVTYLYGLLMISRRSMTEGKRYLSTLGWKINKRRADQWWTKVKKSLKRFDIKRKNRYVHNMFLLKPAN
ncbi:hypothetical protein F2Q69_00054577 [Brassica cretica]|uniref:Uncharacterized protein n=1 Tax=Brassica cretica TaxID=69181 RepID=A0A8S9MX82_BRACR|nr:hypothetical protein F2Q69_00054577 [Brassica cretica]